MPSIDLQSGWSYLFLCGVLLAFFSFMLWMLRHPTLLPSVTPPPVTASPAGIWTSSPLRLEPVITNSPQFGTAWRQQYNVLSPDAAALTPIRISPPDCYPSHNQTRICLGWVRNLLDLPLEAVQLQADWDQEGVPASTTLIEQRQIRGGGLAPYRFYSPDAVVALGVPEVRLSAYHPGRSASVALRVHDERGTALLDSGRYRVQAEIENPYDFAVPLVEAVVTLIDARGRVTGYRVIHLPQGMAARSRQPILVDVLPVALEPDMAHVLNVEAYIDQR